MKTKLTLAIQKSGRLFEKTIKLLRQSGFSIDINGRTLIGKCDNFPLEILFLRKKNIPEIVSDGVADLGICGQDTAAESGLKNLQEIEKLGFGKCRLSLAGKISRNNKNYLENKRIATSFPRILQNFLNQEKTTAEIVSFSGSVEIAPNLGVADLICDLVSTGSTLKMNGLEEIKTIFKSQAVLISTNNCPPSKSLSSAKVGRDSGGRKSREISKKDLLEKFLTRIRATILAKNKKYIVFNLERKNLAKVSQVFPGLKSPTISNLADPDWISVATVVEENVFWETIEKLQKMGAQGILVTPIEKIIL